MLFYRPSGKKVAADVIPYFENGTFYLFYLCDFRGEGGRGEGCDWALLTSRDLLHYEDHGIVLPRGRIDEQDLYVYTGSLLKDGADYYIYYTGHNPHFPSCGKPCQVLLRAKSHDLLHWQKDPSFRLAAPLDYEPNDFRDPFLFREDDGHFGMLITAREKKGTVPSFRGVTLMAHSEDLLHWDFDADPFFAPHAYYAHECCDYFKLGSFYYLVFSEFSDRFRTSYRLSESPRGPWRMGRTDSFDGHAFYAAKSLSDGNRRLLFGWNPIKEGERDEGEWQWGGNIVPSEIVQDPADGSLFVKAPSEILSLYAKPAKAHFCWGSGTYSLEKDKLVLGDEFSRSAVLFEELPEACQLQCRFRFKSEEGDFGLYFGEREQLEHYYAVRFEPAFRRLAFDYWPRKERAEHTLSDVERNCPLEAESWHNLCILKEKSVLEVYVDGRVQMSCRLFAYQGHWGFFSSFSPWEIADLTLTKEAS